MRSPNPNNPYLSEAGMVVLLASYAITWSIIALLLCTLYVLWSLL